jgi:hypothetical protein
MPHGLSAVQRIKALYRIFVIEAIFAAAMLVIASAMAMRPDAGALMTARGALSPMAIASPV